MSPIWKKTVSRSATLLIVAAVAVSFRLGVAVQLSESPVHLQHRWAESDMHFFLGWAAQGARGDLLTRETRLHFHRWHDATARRAFAELRPGEVYTPAAGRAFWVEWYGGPRVLMQEPAFAWAVAALTGGRESRLNILWFAQGLLGVLSALMIALIAREWFSPATGLAAGLLYAACGSAVFYEHLLLRSSLVSFTLVLTCWAALPIFREGVPARSRDFLLLGLAGGCAALVRLSIVPVLLLLPFLYRWTREREDRGRFQQLALYAGGILFALLPLFLRNLALGLGPLEIGHVAHVNFLAGNHVGFRPGTGFAPPGDIGLVLERTGGSFFALVLDTLKSHSIGSYLQHLLGKFFVFWHWFDIPNNSSFEHYAGYSTLMRAAPGWGLFVVLAPIGLLGLARDWNPGRLVPLLFLCGQVAVLTAFHNLGRLRNPAVPFLVILAAYGLILLWRANWRMRLLCLAATVPGLLLLMVPPRIPLVPAVYPRVAAELYRPDSPHKAPAGSVDARHPDDMR